MIALPPLVNVGPLSLLASSAVIVRGALCSFFAKKKADARASALTELISKPPGFLHVGVKGIRSLQAAGHNKLRGYL